MRPLPRVGIPGLLVFLLACGAPGAVESPPLAASFAPTQPKILLLAADDPKAAPAPEIPLRLTASDGTGLRLAALQGRAVIDDPLAFTELHLTFDNPEERTLEGTFAIVLPQGAAISRFSMRNGDTWQEGEVVERQAARVAYEDSLHRRQDPALLEQSAGNEFSARVFPIPAHGRKELIVAYSQELTRTSPYSLPLKGLPRIESVDVSVSVAGRAAPVETLVKANLEPTDDLHVDPKLLGSRAAIRNGNLVLARVRPIVDSQPEPLSSALVLVDTSASRALGLGDELRMVRRVCEGIAKTGGARAPVIVAGYDQGVAPIFDGAAADFGEEAAKLVRGRLALGASDMGEAIRWAGEHAKARGIERVVLVTDGVATAGDTAGDKLREAVKKLGAAGVKRMDAIAVGGIRDDELLRSLVNAGLAHGGTVIDGGERPDEVQRKLSEATRSNLAVRMEGAKFVFPAKVDGVQAGDEVFVYANLPEELPVRLAVGDGPWSAPEVAKVERPLLERAWAGAKIKSLLERERTEGASAELAHEIVLLSTTYRVLSPRTALLVLETDGDYQRFGIERTALSDILVAEGARVGLIKRTAPLPAKVAVEPPPPPPPTRHVEPTGGKVAVRPPSLVRDGEGGGGGSTRPSSRPPAKPAADERTKNAGLMPGDPLAGATARDTAERGPVDHGGQGHLSRLVAPMVRRDADQDGIADAADAMPRPEMPAPTAAPAPPVASAAPGPMPVASPPPPPIAAEPSVERETESSAPPSAPHGRADRGYTFSNDPLAASDNNAAVAQLARPMPQAPEAPKAAPYTGPFKEAMDLIAAGRAQDGLRYAFEWMRREPGDVMALVALGEGFEAEGELTQAARSYGSIIDLFPSRADLRRFAGERLERLRDASALELAIDTFTKAEEQRPDHPSSHRLLAFALLKRGLYERAFEAARVGAARSYPPGRFAGADRILREDLGLIGAAWMHADPKRGAEILSRVRAAGGAIESAPSIRFVLNWETDANDVDFHIYDAEGGHAFYSSRFLPSGGELYADVTTGYGPECFTIRKPPSLRAGPYRLQAHYYSRGPMGYGMGKLEILDHDGQGGITFDERPFVVMVDQAFVDLGVVAK